MITRELDRIGQSLDDGCYRRGDWQKLLSQLRTEDVASVSDEVAAQVTTVSNKLHSRNGFFELPTSYGYLSEAGLLITSVYCLSSNVTVVQLLGVFFLSLCLQPSIKLVTGLALGVRYSYVYLWYFEPRFKMAYGTYVRLTPWKKVVFQFAGSIGTPIALIIGSGQLAHLQLLSSLCLFGAVAAAAMQVAAFLAAWNGVKKVGPFFLTTLTTPAMLAQELRLLLVR